jgi:cell division initiation protein
MSLTPLDIQNKEFTKSGRKGYDATEVNDYLDQVISDYAAVIEENKQLKTRVADFEAQAAQVEEMKGSVTQSILVAQEAADRLKKTADESAKKTLTQAQEESQRMLADATTKSNSLVADAEAKSSSILNDAANDNEKLATETDAIKKDTSDFRNKMQTLLQAQLDLINQPDWSEALEQKGMANAPVSAAHVEKNAAEVVDTDTTDSVNSESSEGQVQTYVLFPETDEEKHV